MARKITTFTEKNQSVLNAQVVELSNEPMMMYTAKWLLTGEYSMWTQTSMKFTYKWLFLYMFILIVYAERVTSEAAWINSIRRRRKQNDHGHKISHCLHHHQRKKPVSLKNTMAYHLLNVSNLSLWAIFSKIVFPTSQLLSYQQSSVHGAHSLLSISFITHLQSKKKKKMIDLLLAFITSVWCWALFHLISFVFI